MKVFDLRCAQGHKFEGWFASEEGYQEQLEQSLLVCPVCGDSTITKLPAATQLSLKSNQKTSLTPAKQEDASIHVGASRLTAEHMHALEEKVMNHILQNTEDVGKGFAEEARKIHYGEALERGIRGQASKEEAQDLQEEGIEIVALPFPAISKKDLQ